ncbi:hypothetical protein [Stenotrophomonas maltophilia]|uniref:hypothetical protein n=1 Tax=Stenotrophomonas maltophilia TaxID=40324 RepID=UPI002E75B675|nr:hypothetical protein [Stenotrophomonas maltophilia]
MPPVVLLSLYRRLCPIADFILFGLEAVIVLCWALLRCCAAARVASPGESATDGGDRSWLALAGTGGNAGAASSAGNGGGAACG